MLGGRDRARAGDVPRGRPGADRDPREEALPQDAQRFDDYCEERWGFTGRRGRRLMQAAEIGTVVPVENEAQARALVEGLPSGPEDVEQIRQVWADAEERADGGRVTVALIRKSGKLRVRDLALSEEDFSMQFSPPGTYRPDREAKRGIRLRDLPGAVAAHDRAQAKSDAIRADKGKASLPESAHITAWRRRLAQNGNASAPPDLRKAIAIIEKRRAIEPAGSPDHAALTRALDALREVM